MMRCGTGTASDFVLLVATPDQGEGKVYFFKLGAGSSMHSVKTHYSRRGRAWQGVAHRASSTTTALLPYVILPPSLSSDLSSD